MSFIIGDKVIYVTSQEKGVVVKVHTPARGRQLYDVVINGSIGQFSSSNLIADFELTDPFERVAQGLFGVRSDFSQINTKITYCKLKISHLVLFNTCPNELDDVQLSNF